MRTQHRIPVEPPNPPVPPQHNRRRSEPRNYIISSRALRSRITAHERHLSSGSPSYLRCVNHGHVRQLGAAGARVLAELTAPGGPPCGPGSSTPPDRHHCLAPRAAPTHRWPWALARRNRHATDTATGPPPRSDHPAPPGQPRTNSVNQGPTVGAGQTGATLRPHLPVHPAPRHRPQEINLGGSRPICGTTEEQRDPWDDGRYQ